jgi:cysteine desulfurase/selenocysteine lyase
LYGKSEHLHKMPPYQLGGGMIQEVGLKETSFASNPQIFEAGTPNIAGAIGLSAAMNYVHKVGYEFIEKQEKDLLEYGAKCLSEIEEVEMLGDQDQSVSLISFNVKGQHPFDVGSLLDQMGIAVRTGHHCTQPIMNHFGIPGTVRASFAFYNTLEEIDAFISALKRVIKMLS